MVYCKLIFSIPLSTVYVFITIPALLGNIFLFSVIFRSKKFHRKSYSRYLMLLTITDNFSIFFLLLEFIERLFQKTHNNEDLFPKNNITCKIEKFAKYTCFFISACATVCLTTERFLILYWPVRGRLMCRGKQLAFIIVGIVVFSSAFQSFRLFFTVNWHGRCIFKMGTTKDNFLVSGYTTGIFVYIIPGLVILILNILILIELVHSDYKTKCQKCLKNRSKTKRFTINICKSFPWGRSSQSTVRRLIEENDSSVLSDRSNVTYDDSMVCSKCRYLKQDSAKYYLRVKRRASIILLLISFSYLICHLWNTGLSLYQLLQVHFYAPMFKNLSINSTKTMEIFNRTWTHIRYTKCLYSDVADMFSIIGYGINFYIYYIFGKIFRIEFARMCQNISETLRCTFCIGRSVENKSKPGFKKHCNNLTVYKDQSGNHLYFYPISECYIRSHFEGKNRYYHKNSYQSVWSCP